ncbi:uncharacterized protein LOC129577954 isoform X3 [Sitodiplosis mosellana]|uniref:uncharacterized protein LOC129577954 isoform X3 n=1 Tax=Sitodiplosis mosellana TaxID=263140 RepID=UPI002444FC82|nr:uncharacterized protein LOC129577954 isoform X3 [Sitodiplosis mosellana]XP_055321819.1 uncharacterized protein LOC129577954 isoform X3 [Sitodiplosis mosellana]
MDILWLQNTVSRQFLVNTVTTLSEQLITINNVVTGLVSGGINATVTKDDATNTPTKRSNETLFTQKLINSIRGNVACTHRHGFSGDTDNYLYQQKSAQSQSSVVGTLFHPPQHQHWHPLPKCTARTIKNIKAIGNIVNLDIEKSGTISTYDCDSNYTTTNATRTTITCHSNYGTVNNNVRAEHNVKNDKCNYNNNNNNDNNKSNEQNRSTSTTSVPTSSRLNRINIDSPIDIAPISTKPAFYVQFEKRAQRSQNQWWKNLVIVICYLFLLSSSLRICSANKHDVSNCTFPQRWEGSWFLSGNQQPIFIKGNTLSFRGKCMASDGDKFLIVDEKGCHRCLVIYEKHKNVLQYKENYCKGRETLQNLCEQIAGDALLYSLFKENAEPVKCPLRGPFTFTYNRGHGECRNPVSNIESCTEDSRLLLNLQACPDVAGTESTVEELTCLATWKDGNSRYLVGLVSHLHAVSNEERYRCFVYEKILSNDDTSKDAEYKLAQSGDATCNGLDSAEVGSRIMTLRRSPPTERCDFPAWFKGPKHWHSLAGNNQYVYHQSDGSMHILKPNGHMETRALCEQINKNAATETQVIVHQTTGCKSGYMCMIFYRRDTHIAEVQMGLPAVRLEDACTVDNFDVMKLPYVTLVAATVDPQECPLNGLYSLRGAIGPPFISSRHKRNHNKGHHHHHEAQYKRYTALSFRNPEEFSNLDLQMRSRIAPLRNRREVRSKRLSNGTIIESSNNIDANNDTAQIILPTDDKQNTTEIDIQRSKRETPECVINYNSARQLFVGCSQSNVVEVKPHCSDDGDEVYNCQGSWTENTTTFIVALHSGSQHAVCISYQPVDATNVRLYVGDSCYRSMPLQTSDHHLAANLTVIGKCTDVSSASPTVINWNVLHITLLFTIIALIRSR